MFRKTIIAVLSIPFLMAVTAFAGNVMVPYATHKVVTDKLYTGTINAGQLSQNLLLAVKTGENTDSLVLSLCSLDEKKLREELSSVNQKRAFWINLYNAFGQLLLEKDPTAIRNWSSRLKHYSSKKICIAGNLLSLNDIEHGMLRHSKIWWSLGYLSKWFPNSFEKAMRVPLDKRIHFVLNCGAKSCPPIAFYNPEQLEQQLDVATKVYLKQDVVYDEQKNIISITELVKWYKNDFGGKKKLLSFLKKYQLIPHDANPVIRYHPYDWSLLLRYYR